MPAPIAPRSDGRANRRGEISVPHLARERRRPLHRHRHVLDYARSRRELAECRRLSRPDRTGAQIDVEKFPSPIWHEKDGGRYIGTGTFSITRDPEENWLNAGAYRAQIGRARKSTWRNSRPPSGTRKTAAATSAPARSRLRAIPKRIG